MNDIEYTDDKLNMFIDGQLDTDDMDGIHDALLNDKSLRQRVCQLKAVRELVNYAYDSVPVPESASVNKTGFSNPAIWRSLAASLLLVFGAVVGWAVNDNYHAIQHVASSDDVFQYFKHKSTVNTEERKIILHVTTGDIYAVNKALDEAEQLLASYEQAGTPMKLDIVTYKEGINMLRVGVSPYVQRIEDLLEANANVTIYACQRSVEKARAKEGQVVEFIPHTVTAKTAQELISERLEKGWIYIKV
jgi:intracellular sulfur oxidation DsrE/DsrF family protein